jgi:hypothetical protein
MEQNQIGFFNPENGTMTPLVRDARISWVDTSELRFCPFGRCGCVGANLPNSVCGK